VTGSSTDLDYTFIDSRLGPKTAVLAKDHEGVCIFVNDDASADALEGLKAAGVKFIALRCAGFNNVSDHLL
jgi:lactate dehydrogenase-like 2-hydroxyacid dehydrogenase